MILSVENIHKSYGKEKVLKGISFTIEKPEIIALVGPNGSGKSTLLNIITNLLSPDSGQVTVLNKTNRDANIFRDISFMQDNTVLYEYLTGYDHLQFIGDVQNIPKEQILKTAEKLGIESYLNKKVQNYSLGMKQHLLLAMAVVNEPKLLILDEPLNGLDPTSAIKVRELLIELREEGTAILLSSHNLGEIDRVTSNILFLKDGLLIEEDISKYEQVCYEMHLSNVKKGKEILASAHVETEFVDDKLLVYEVNVPLNEMIQRLSDEHVQLLGIEKKIIGSEERYKKIFGEKEQIQ